MFNSLNKYGLPTKYAIIGLIGGIIGAFISQAMELNDGGISYIIGVPVAGLVGGAIGGWFRKRSGKSN